MAAKKRSNRPAKRTKKVPVSHLPNNPSQTSPPTASSPLSERQWLHLALVCAVSSILLYVNTRHNDYVFDDSAAVVNNPDVRGESPLKALFQNDFWATPLQDSRSHKSYRPMTTASFRLTAFMHGIEPMPFHLTNVVLNAIACYMAVYCIKHMMPSSSSWVFPVVACLLFTFHPIHTEVVATIVGRADLLAAIFAFGAFQTHALCMNLSLNVLSSKLMFTLLLAWLSALSKETGLMVLGICGAHEVALIWLPIIMSSNTNQQRKELKISIIRFVVLALTGVAYFGFRKVINGPSTGVLPSAGDNPLITSETSLQYGLTAAFIMVMYIWRLLNPFTLLCDYGYNVVPLVQRMSDVRNVATCGLLVGVLLLAFIGIRQACQKYDYRILMALSWIFVPLLPASHILVLGTVVAERLLFLPSLGYCMLVALVAEHICQHEGTNNKRKKRNQMFASLLVLLLALFTSRILSRNGEWMTSETLWKADYDSHPQNIKISMKRATDLAHDGDTDAAWHVVKDLEGLGDVQRFELCILQAKMTASSDAAGRDFDRAYQILDDCTKEVNARRYPSKVDHLVFSAYGYLLSQQERHEEAAAWFGKASESSELVGANAIGPVCNEGEILARLGKWTESLPALKKCVEMSRQNREHGETKQMNLAKAYFMSKEFDQAERLLVDGMSETKEAIQFLETVRKAKKQHEEWKKRKEQHAST